MKTIQILTLLVACLTMSFVASSQTVRTESFTVSGECGMCKKKIESAAKQAGATEASWSPQTRVIKVTYNAASGNVINIKQAIANVGYDTPGFRAPDDVYNSLDKCCQYKREGRTAQCCAGKDGPKDEKCAAMPTCMDKDCCKKS